MKIRTKALVAGGAALTALALAPPAAYADVYEDQGRADFTFMRGGRSVTCTVEGSSRFEYPAASSDEYSYFEATTQVVDGDTGCGAAGIHYIGILGEWSRPQKFLGSAHSTSTHSRSTYLSVFVDAVPADVAATHYIEFACDDELGGCYFSFGTSPK